MQIYRYRTRSTVLPHRVHQFDRNHYKFNIHTKDHLAKMATSLLLNCGTKARYAIIQLTTKNSKTIASLLLLLRKENNTMSIPMHRNYSVDSGNGNNSSSDNNTSKNGTKSKSGTEQKKNIKSIPDSEIRKSVFISQSYDIFTNLALEDWFYRNFDFTNHHVLMLWANDPCVVVGRHQNPFLEANVTKLEKAGIELARRNSGGGTVYHDRGNMNLTFFTPRERYNRTYNLNIVTRALFREWGIKAEISKRDDITLYEKKVMN